MAITSLILDKGYLNSLSEIVSDGNALVGYARICGIGPDYLEFSPGRNENELPRLLYGTPVKVNIHNTKLGFKVFSGIAGGSSDSKLKLTGLEMLSDKERRQFLRVNVGVEAELIHTASASGGELIKRMAGGRIEDISLSGLRFSVPALMMPGDRVTANFKLLEFDMNLDCTIKRIVKRDEAGAVHYGCFYTRMSSSQEETLHKLLLRLQQTRRSRL